MSGVITALVAAAALARAAAQQPAEPELSFEEVFMAEPAERPDVRSAEERRRAAREEALGWLDAAVDDGELVRRGEEGRRIDFADFAEPSSGPEGVVWKRPSLLTLGRVPGQPDSEEWLRWQAAVEAARRWREARAAEAR